MGTYHVGFGGADQLASDLGQTVGELPGESMGMSQSREIMGKTIISGGGHGPDLSNTTSERFSEPSCLFDELARADNHPGMSVRDYEDP